MPRCVQTRFVHNSIEMPSHWDGIFRYILVDFPSRGIGKIKKGFRVLRDATQGAALRTREPFEKGSSENFNYGCGGDFGHEKTSLHGQRGFSFAKQRSGNGKKSALRDCANRASASASAAVNTSVRVDDVLAVALRNRANRALTCAGTAADASARNYVCHGKSTSNSNYTLILT